MLRFPIAPLIAVACFAGVAAGQDEKTDFVYPPVLPGSRIETYKTVGDTRLDLYVYDPPGHRATDRCAAIVFFFGGGWTKGSPSQFEQHCKHLASRGLVAITADYRVTSRNQVKVLSSVADAKSAIRYVRSQAGRLGIDPDRIVAGGGSAGGHVAACTGVIRGFDEPGEDARISSVPDALVLFNPAVLLAPVDELDAVQNGRLAAMKDQAGADPQALSPYLNITAGAPPTIIFHGRADPVVPYGVIETFAKAMTAAGNQCTLLGYDGQVHGFFNYGRGGNEYYERTMRALDEFLLGLGYIDEAKAEADSSTLESSR